MCLLYTPADTQLEYTSDTYNGSSGSPVLTVEDGELVLLAVHRAINPLTITGIGSIVTEDFVTRLRCLTLSNKYSQCSIDFRFWGTMSLVLLVVSLVLLLLVF